jgi:hypothetical protein
MSLQSMNFPAIIFLRNELNLETALFAMRWIWLPLLFVASWFAPRFGERWFGAVERAASRLASHRGWAIAAVAIGATLVRLAMLARMPVPVPHVHDEFSYLMMGDTFAHGRLANPPHAMWIFLDTFHELQRPTYASIFPPAQGALLALGQVLGHPWIGVLLNMTAACAAITWMLQGWVPARWALLGGILAVMRIYICNYWVESYWGGGVAALGGALVVGALPRILKRQRIRDAVLMGVGAGLLANSRPLEGALFCVPVAVPIGWWLFSERGVSFRDKGLRVVLPLVGTLAAVLVFMGYYNWRVTGNALLMPHMLYSREYINYPIFVWQTVRAPLHYSNPQFEEYFNGWVRNAFGSPWINVFRAFYLWGVFFIGAVLCLPFIELPRLVRSRHVRFLLIQFCLCAVGLLMVVYFEPHYAAPLTATVFALLIQSMRYMRRWKIKGRPVGIFFTRLVVLLAIARVATLAVVTGPGMPMLWSFQRARIQNQLNATPGNHLVLVHYGPKHSVHKEWVYNAADIDGSKIVWAREIPGVDVKPLLEYFKQRIIWEIDADANPVEIHPYRGPN